MARAPLSSGQSPECRRAVRLAFLPPCLSSGESAPAMFALATRVAKMILTGDINLMNVDDPSVPFARVQEAFHADDMVFSNLECCLYDPPVGHAVENEGFFASSLIGGEALRAAGIGAVGIANNVNYGDAAIT